MESDGAPNVKEKNTELYAPSARHRSSHNRVPRRHVDMSVCLQAANYLREYDPNPAARH
jgi:hypothetical protein